MAIIRPKKCIFAADIHPKVVLDNLHIYMIQVDKGICPHNHVCPLIKACSVGAISQDAEGFPVIDYSLCIECGKCVRKCPMKAMRQVEK